MTIAITADRIAREPELVGQVVVVIVGAPGSALRRRDVLAQREPRSS